MITQEENDLLTQTNRDTPCGELMRRYWQPTALSAELLADQPLPVQLFGEELILFRDGAGQPALIGRYCAHQGVDMIYGRVEPDGLRCMYHGWLFDNCGKVVLRGDWLPEKERRWDVGQPAYPCVEAGGIVFTYMGPGDPPVLPADVFATAPEGCAPTKTLCDENYLQRIIDAPESFDGASFVMPNLVAFAAPSANAENSLRWHVPVDDNSHVEFILCFVGTLPLSDEPKVSPHQLLLEAIQEIRKARPVPPGSGEID